MTESEPVLLPSFLTGQTLPGLCIFGEGGMSAMVETVARRWELTITNVFSSQDLRNGWPRKKSDLKGAQVGLDFSGSEIVLDNVRKAVELKLPLVVGVTGWRDQAMEVESIVLNGEGALLHSPNFSFAFNILVQLLKHAALFFDGEEEYDPFVWEKHHASKMESPSSTALYLGETLLDAIDHKDLLHFGTGSGLISPNQLSVASIRAGSDPGYHKVGFDGRAETLELIHKVRDLSACAAGAIRAACWLPGRRGIFTMDDVMEDVVLQARQKRKSAEEEGLL